MCFCIPFLANDEPVLRRFFSSVSANSGPNVNMFLTRSFSAKRSTKIYTKHVLKEIVRLCKEKRDFETTSAYGVEKLYEEVKEILASCDEMLREEESSFFQIIGTHNISRWFTAHNTRNVKSFFILSSPSSSMPDFRLILPFLITNNNW